MKTAASSIQQFGLPPRATTGLQVRRLGASADGVGADHPVGVPHRDLHYLLVLLTAGTCILSLDFESVPVQAPALVTIFPGQVHCLLTEQDLQGWGVSFDPALLDDELRPVVEERFPTLLPLAASSALYRQATGLLPLLHGLPAEGPAAYAGRIGQALLGALLGVVAGHLLAGGEALAPAPATQPARLEHAFRWLVEQHYPTWKQPARYAAALAVSAAYLNDTIKRRTGLPLSGHIQRRAVLEAKRLLGFTTRSVKEIGYAVGYEEPISFGRAFKRVTGLTPLAFRRQFHQSPALAK